MDANMIGAYGPWAAGLVGRRAGAAVVPQPAVPGRRPRRLARPGTRAAARLSAAARHRASPQSRSFSISSSTTGCTSSI